MKVIQIRLNAVEEQMLKEVCAVLGLSSPPQALEVERRKRGKYQEPMSEELHRRLNVFYRPWNEQFVEKVGWASSWNDVGS